MKRCVCGSLDGSLFSGFSGRTAGEKKLERRGVCGECFF